MEQFNELNTQLASIATSVEPAVIINDLTTGGTTVALSAEQGKTLKGEVGTLASLATTEKGSLVGAINELNADKIETTAIANTLTETAEGKVLDARQGKVLKDLVDTNTQFTDVDNVVYSWRFIKSAEGHMQLEYMEVI